MLARSECVSVVPGSAHRPFLLDDVELELDADERLWEAVRDFNLETVIEFSGSRFGRRVSTRSLVSTIPPPSAFPSTSSIVELDR
jgi:hypothetical protein